MEKLFIFTLWNLTIWHQWLQDLLNAQLDIGGLKLHVNEKIFLSYVTLAYMY